MAGVLFHVNGLATIKIGTAILGYSVDGVTIDLDAKNENVMTDLWGSQIPEDVLNMGQEARVTCELVKYDEDVLIHAQNRVNSSGTYGQLPNASDATHTIIGGLYKQCGYSDTLTITRGVSCTDTSGTVEGGYRFNVAFLDGVDSFKVGTRVTKHTLTWRCLPDFSGVLFVAGSGI